jgi:hypothetical protein
MAAPNAEEREGCGRNRIEKAVQHLSLTHSCVLRSNKGVTLKEEMFLHKQK